MTMKQYVLAFPFSCGLLYTVSWMICNASETKVFGSVSCGPLKMICGNF